MPDKAIYSFGIELNVRQAKQNNSQMLAEAREQGEKKDRPKPVF
jgi:hypothetical protein